MGNNAVGLVVRELEARVRPVQFRLPFKFGAMTLTACPQMFVRATVDVPGHGRATGYAAEMMVPGWFDKRSSRTAQENVRDLARSFELVVSAYVGDAEGTSFDLFSRHYESIAKSAVTEGMTPLSAAFGQAVTDRAVIDALCRALQTPFFDVARANVLGLHACEATSDLPGFAWNEWLQARSRPASIEARHTVCMLDPLDGPPVTDATELPNHLRAIIQWYGHRFFKIKLGGDLEKDRRRLSEILAMLERTVPGFHFTLDGNEQYPDLEALDALLGALKAEPLIASRPEALLYLEQPTARDSTFDRAVESASVPLLIDEADDSLNAFPRARALGWTGVSSKGCKGIYKAIINAARCSAWNSETGVRRFFMSAEDLCCQAGLAVQQDLAIAALLQIQHAERNGHHYVDGMFLVTPTEADAFQKEHRDLYDLEAGHPRLRLTQGGIEVGTLLKSRGFAHTADPAFLSMSPLSMVLSMSLRNAVRSSATHRVRLRH